MVLSAVGEAIDRYCTLPERQAEEVGTPAGSSGGARPFWLVSGHTPGTYTAASARFHHEKIPAILIDGATGTDGGRHGPSDVIGLRPPTEFLGATE